MFPCDSRESSKKVSSLCGPSISIDSMDASSEAPPAWSMCPWVNKIFSGIKLLSLAEPRRMSKSPPGSTNAHFFVSSQNKIGAFC